MQQAFMRIWCKKSISSITSFLLYSYLNENINVKKTLTFICRQKMKFIFRVSLEILFRVFWIYLATQTQSDTTNLQKKYCLSADKNHLSTPCFSAYIAVTSYFWYFGHALLHTPKMIVSACRILLCLSACSK